MIKVAVLAIFFLILFVAKLVNMENDSGFPKSVEASDGINKNGIKPLV